MLMLSWYHQDEHGDDCGVANDDDDDDGDDDDDDYDYHYLLLLLSLSLSEALTRNEMQRQGEIRREKIAQTSSHQIMLRSAHGLQGGCGDSPRVSSKIQD